MTEGCGHVTLLLDPTVDDDAMHAALFRAPWVTRLSARYLGARIERYEISGSIQPATYETTIWGEKISFELRTRWEHKSMTQHEACLLYTSRCV